MPVSVIIYCFHLPPRLGQCPASGSALVAVAGGGLCWQPGEELDGTVALEPAVLVALAACQAGGSVVPTQDSSHSVLLKPGCSSLVSGVQLMLSTLPWLLCSLFLALLWVKPAYLWKDFYSQPARRFMQITSTHLQGCNLSALPSVYCG